MPQISVDQLFSDNEAKLGFSWFAGKSGGSRVITCVRVQRDVVYLLDIYDKSDRENISDEELDTLIDQIDALED